ncbi:MAG: hypothetical protein IKW83_10725 [Muribaculaceae bacterium]|nr:hypothetical protein [Muribaculaceae bacterium]
MKRVLAIICLVATLGISQGYSKSVTSFFSSNNNRAYRILLMGAHPTNQFVSGSCNEHNGYVTVTIWSKSGNDNHKTVINLYLKNGVFTRLDVCSCTDFWPCFLASSLCKKVIENVYSEFNSGSINNIEKLYNKLIKNMEIEELCTAYLSLKYLTYNK